MLGDSLYHTDRDLVVSVELVRLTVLITVFPGAEIHIDAIRLVSVFAHLVNVIVDTNEIVIPVVSFEDFDYHCLVPFLTLYILSGRVRGFY